MVCGFLFSCLVLQQVHKIYCRGRYGFNFDGSLDFCVGCGSFGRLTKNGLNKAIKLQLSFYYPQAVFVGRVKYLRLLSYAMGICCLHRIPICCLTFLHALKMGSKHFKRFRAQQQIVTNVRIFPLVCLSRSYAHYGSCERNQNGVKTSRNFLPIPIFYRSLPQNQIRNWRFSRWQIAFLCWLLVARWFISIFTSTTSKEEGTQCPELQL